MQAFHTHTKWFLLPEAIKICTFDWPLEVQLQDIKDVRIFEYLKYIAAVHTYECFSDSLRISRYDCTQINIKLVQTCDKYHTIECSIGKSDDSLRRATDCIAQRAHALLATYKDHSHTLKSALHRRICLFVPDTPFVFLMLKLRMLECEHLFIFLIETTVQCSKSVRYSIWFILLLALFAHPYKMYPVHPGGTNVLYTL